MFAISALQIILIVLIAVLSFGIVIVFAMSQVAARKKHALNMIQGRNAPQKKGKVNEKDKRRADLATKLKESKDEEEQLKKKKKTTLNMMIEQAGLSISVKQYWLFSFISMIGFVAAAQLFGYPPHVTLAAAFIGLLGLPRFVLKKMSARRQKKFLSEFPDALEATVRLLKAGMPVSESISMIAREWAAFTISKRLVCRSMKPPLKLLAACR